MKDVIINFWNRFERAITLETDSPDVKRRKVTLVVIAILCSFTGLFFGTRNYVDNRPFSEILMPYLFLSVVGSATLIYFHTRRFAILSDSFSHIRIEQLD